METLSMSSLTIIHTSDWHCGASRNIPEYLNRWRDAFDEMIEKIDKYKPDVFVVTGDLFDNRTPTEEERNLILSTISRILIKFPKIYVLILEGNHDWNTQETSMLESVREGYLPVGSRIKIVRDKPEVVRIKGSNFICIPCTQSQTKKSVKKLVKKLHKGLEGDTYVCMHECFKSFAENGMEVGTESLPKLKFVKCWMLGDIHKHQFLAKNAWYAGSPLQINFGEKSQKGIVLVYKGKHRFIELKSPKKLITIKQGDKVPDNCIVKYIITNPLEFDKSKLPDSVASVETSLSEATTIKLENSGDITEGLAQMLAEKFGMSEKYQKKAIKYINGLIAR